MNIADNIKLTILQSEPLFDKLPKYLVGKFLKGKKYQETNISINQLPEVITTGKILACLYTEKEFIKEKDYISEHNLTYIGSQIVFVDVDGCPDDLDPDKFMSKIKYKPTAYSTSYSNKLKTQDHPNGDKEWRIHMYYVFDEIIYGIENYYTILDRITADFPKEPDKAARSPKRIIFTCNRDKQDNKVFFKEGYSYTVYKTSDFLVKNDPSCIVKKNVTPVNAKNRERFNLDPDFLRDFNKMSRGDFVKKYDGFFLYYTETYLDPDVYKFCNGYKDIRGVDYYVVPTAQRIWSNTENRSIHVKVMNGKRNMMLWLTAVAIKKIIPDITKEKFLHAITRELWKNFNDNYEFTNDIIIRTAEDVWNTPDEEIDYSTVKKDKKFQIDMQYWREQGIDKPQKAVGKARKNMNDDDITKYYNTELTIEQNIEVLHKNGLKTKKERLIQWCEEYNVEYTTEKDIRDKAIIELRNDNPTISEREIARILNERGIKVTKNTVHRVLS